MKDEEQLFIEIDDDALAETPQAGDGVPVHGRQRRVNGAQEERAAQPDRLEGPTHDSPLEGLEIDEDIWKLWHVRDFIAAPSRGALAAHPGG
jgi:hypothetical protein